MIELSCIQGSPEWKASRKTTRNASDYPAAQGLSKKYSRSALVAEIATGIEREFSPFMEKILANGHRVEALARSMAEVIIGEELYPLVATSDDGYLGASSDGATMLMDTGFECKQWNSELAASVAIGVVPETHSGQLDQQGEVFGFERILFMVTDGTPEYCVYCWYVPSEEAKAKIRPTWKLFDEDVAAYVPESIKPAALAEVIEDLPALTVQLVGNVASSNLPAFQSAVLARIQAINTTLVTDSDFATADKMVKFLDDGEKRLELVKSQALAQTASIDQLFRTIDSLKDEMKQKRLTLDKLVMAEKGNRRAEIVTTAQANLAEHGRSLSARIGVTVPVFGNFAEAIKGLKSLDSMRDKVSVALANAKIEANALADRISTNQNMINGEDLSLFPDFAAVCQKAPEDFAALLAMRINQRKEAEEKRLTIEREKIRIEEQAKAQRQASMAASCVSQISESETLTVAPVATVLSDKSFSDTCNTIKIGEICARLGFTVSAEFLASLGFEAETVKSAKLYPAALFPTICRKISDHTLSVAVG